MTTATGAYVTKLDCQNRITAAMVVQLFDDGGDGVLDQNEENALQDFILDCESEIEQAVRRTYGDKGLTWLRAQGFTAPRAIKRMTLDLFEVRAYRRHPSYVRAEWEKREAAVERDIKALQIREYELDTVADPEPAALDGGEARSGDPDQPTTTPKRKVFLDGTGLY